MLGASDKSSGITLEKLLGQKHLRALSRYLRIKRRFWDQLNGEGLFLLDFMISQSVLDCQRAGLGAKASEIVSAAEFENAQLPSLEGFVLEEINDADFGEALLSRLARIAYQMESSKRARPHREVLLEKSLRSTLSDLEDLGLGREAKKAIRRGAALAKANKQQRALAQK